VIEQGKILEKWTGYFEKLVHCDDPTEEFPRVDITTNDSVCQHLRKKNCITSQKVKKNINRRIWCFGRNSEEGG